MRFLSALVVVLLFAGCADRSQAPVVPAALQIGSNRTVFAATSRLPEADGTFGYRRSDTLRLLELTVSIPPGRQPGTLDFGYARPDPRKQFTMARRKVFTDDQAFRSRLQQALGSQPDAAREITIFVHGFNATQAETAFRAAQVAHDTNMPGLLMVYSWPSRGKPLAYAYDGDSALFARDGLETLVREVKSAGVDRIVLVAHSMGSFLTMETLRQIDLQDPGWAARNLAGVVLISPDLDVEVFRAQMLRLSVVPEPFVIFVSSKDKVLNISSRLRGTYRPQRLGNLSSIDRIRDLPVEVIDTTAFADSAGSSHFIPATSPALLAMLKGAQSVSRTFGPEDPALQNLLSGLDVRAKGATEIVLAPASGGNDR